MSTPEPRQAPHEILGVAPDADLETLRRRYLELVRQHPPEKDPDRFSQIRAAYGLLRNPIEHLHRRLFDTTTYDNFDVLLAELQTEKTQQQRLPTELLLSLAED